ncbi:unnamed protein product [Parascedosporium putredinis]|uniref:Tyrosinase copper-binding domain-containing protein n=1 Tax=Parascedosporium putredinis TaxID=1442378 RepID=A0A9P1H568_9PEZI|nr:unnamed protein product [Parascedosporium putredinis]CAI7996183.1 unnamed protein product [Parascedosporium putredinis]
MAYGKTEDIVNSIVNYNDILAFQNFMQGGTGVHGVGHFTVSGDPGGDFYISPNEPSFWLHHAMIDRIWTIWHMMGGGRAQSLDDLVDLGVIADTVYPIRDILSSVDGPGPFCYVYE